MKVWTFEIRGLTKFSLGFSPESGILAPALVHQGGRTLWKMAGSAEHAQQVECALLEMGLRVRRDTEEQTPEQEMERMLGPLEDDPNAAL